MCIRDSSKSNLKKHANDSISKKKILDAVDSGDSNKSDNILAEMHREGKIVKFLIDKLLVK